MPEKTAFTYDEIAYPNFIHPQTHPNRLATMATAYGMQPEAIENCRVLEIGCGSGSNLMAMADGLPESEFVGIDLSENQIRYGRNAAAEIGLGNLQLICADILQINPADFGKFDYIVAHGVFSWTPPEVREKILAICRECLAAQGVAFVSYNAFPGGHLRQMMREMMLYHTENIESPVEKVNQSIVLLGFLHEAAVEKEIYPRILKYEFEKTLERRVEVVLHDDLMDFNEPFYFYEFILQAEKHDLQFLSEAEYFPDKFQHSNPSATNLLNQFGDDFVRREQYLDFLKNRRFRQTLLCHGEISLERKVKEDFFDKVRIASELRPEASKPDFSPQAVEKFAAHKTGKIEIDHAVSKAALYHLGKIFPRSASFQEIIESAAELLKEQTKGEFEVNADEQNALKEILLQIFSSNLIEFYVYELNFTDKISEKPQISPLARWQARNGNTISTRRFGTVTITDEFVRNLLILLDGNHGIEDIAREFGRRIENNQFQISFADEEEKQKLLDNLPFSIEENLRRVAKLGLLAE